ncbi:MAG: Peptidase family protein, partial [Bacteroidota bacterium]|nr:Peptidase family protein [Bacteroidota bacterium]
MKKSILFIFWVVVSYFNPINAAFVNVQTAQAIALNFFKVNSPGQGNISATLNYTRIESDSTIDYYVFDINPAHGFVIVSADDNMNPVIAYSTEANFNAAANRIGLSDWMKHSAAKIHYGIQQHVSADARINHLWNAYLLGQNPNSSRSGGVGPLLSTTWDQEPHYNSLCPYNSADHQNALTGCVATAMGQIMKYWAYPAHGTGSYSYNDSPPNFSNNYGTQYANFGNTNYDWANMPNSINGNNNDLATLMYHCGVSVAMDYGDDNEGGSGAWVLQSEAGGATAPCAQYSYVNYFAYNPNTIQGVQFSHYGPTDWLNLMESELDAGRAIQYEGDDPQSGGHTWVCDGYDGNNMLHMNWGWGGQDNGYFDVSNLNAGSYNFSTNEAALIGIEPLTPVSVTASANSPAICNGSSTTLNAHGPSTASYSWTPQNGLSCHNCASPVANPVHTTVYTVTADSAGITGRASVTVTITPAASANFSLNSNSSCAVPVDVSFSNASNNAVSYLWDFGDGTTGIIENPVHSYNAYGNFSVKLFATNACGVDSLIKNQLVNIVDLSPVAASLNICAGQSAALVANGAGTLNWYDAANGGNLLVTGNSYTTPALTASTTYFVSGNIQAAVNLVGPTDNVFGTGGYFTSNNQRSVIFNCTTAQTLLTADVYAQNAGARTIVLQDSTGAQIDSATITIPAGFSTITLNFALPEQNGLILGVIGNNGLYRNKTGANYPYNSTDGTISITGSDAGEEFYYFFYNWKLQQSACITTRTAVAVNVLGAVGSPFTTNDLGNFAISFIASNNGIPSYYWTFGDGYTSTLQNPTHTYATSGNYIVRLIEASGNCADTLTQTITVTGPSGVEDISSFGNISVFPNPAKDQLNLTIVANQAINNCQVSIYNVLGEALILQNAKLDSGSNSVNLDVARLSAGVYF